MRHVAGDTRLVAGMFDEVDRLEPGRLRSIRHVADGADGPPAWSRSGHGRVRGVRRE